MSAPKADQQAVPSNHRVFSGKRDLGNGRARGQAITTFAPGTTLPSANEAREAMPVASGRR